MVSGALVALWLGVGSTLAIWLAWPIRDWSVMTDEMLYAKLATSMAETGSPLPRIHETSAAVYNLLYPLLLAPLYAALSPPQAFRAAHVLNAFVMASAAFPAYLLAREVLSRGWSFLVAALSILVPWMLITSALMTESVAYPAFLWAVLGLQNAVARPSRRADGLAVAALAVAVLARTQFFALVLVLPLAIIGHEVGRAFLAPRANSTGRKLIDGACRRRTAASPAHTPLRDRRRSRGRPRRRRRGRRSLGRLRRDPREGSILPSSMWPAAARHIDSVAIGLGLVPLVLGGGWMLATAVRPRREREHALATLSLVTIALLAIEVGSFTVRFEGANSSVVRDRYLFYIAPLLLLGTVAGLTRTPRRHLAAGSALATILFAATASQLPFTTKVYPDAPTSIVNRFLVELSGPIATGTFVALGGLLVGFGLALSVLLLPRTVTAPVVVGVLLTFSLFALYGAGTRTLSSPSLAGRPLTAPSGTKLDWVDAALPEGATAGILSFPVSSSWWPSATRWWDVEFWNRSITQAHVASDGNFAYTGWPRKTLSVNWVTGGIRGTSDAPSFVVLAADDPRFLPAGERLASSGGLVVRSAERPYRAVWASRGLDADGWAGPGSPATIRVFPVSGRTSHLARAQVSLRAPDRERARYRISAPGAVRLGQLAEGELRRIGLPVCVPARSPVDVTVTTSSNARIDDPPLSPTIETTRQVGAKVGPISVTHTGRPCGPSTVN